jgi:hypothetical protein
MRLRLRWPWVARSWAEFQTRRADRLEAERDIAVRLAEQRLTTIETQTAELAKLRDEKPATPISYPKPSPAAVRLLQLLSLSEKARRALDEDRSELIHVNVQLTREVRELREAAAAAAEGSAA